ncbi:insulinase family protein [Cellulosilyticum sp. I15G10I2]|uniref:insulinase family protein n=1 Tax=Cellulosilyticum sp. I15G10I2 TaxID=1892843 RepID=UPI00085C4602|nr:insulinase family protein [Cellulosilyticum sp. I15G10I2]
MAKLVKGYTLIEDEYIKEIDSKVNIYSHDQTKARILFIENDDVHKSFCIGFRTPPHDSTGAPHIIEHSVLCGSKKYPLKDPFVELAKGSLNTYLNAMTYPDKTLYPISSQNDKDFSNLMDVYLDAVFFPKIYENPEILKQEGWRYHIEDKNAPIEYKGVVYNEMKGAFSSQEEIGFRMIKESLFPDTAYSHESGGSPKYIPDLSYDDFLDFHRTYYHPSNSYLCLYGNIDIEETLSYIDNEYFSKFAYKDIDSQIKHQQPFEKIIEKKGYYSATEENNKGLFLSYNFVIGEVTDRKLVLAVAILEYLLLDTPASPLKKALIAEGIGEDVYGMFQTHLKQPVLSIVAKSVPEEKRERFYTLVLETLEKIADEGIPRHLLKGAIQVKEFELREGDSSGHSKGLFYALAAIKSWVYDVSPYIYLKYDEDIEALKAQIDTGYFENLIKQYLLKNNHGSKIELYPKLGLENELEEEVTHKLEILKKNMTEDAIRQMVADTEIFKKFQDQLDSEEVRQNIPLLKKEDLRRKVTYPRYNIISKHETTYIVTPIFTNKIAYINWYIKLDDLEDKYMPYLGMIVGMLGKLDTKHYKYEALSSTIDENIGGIEYHIQALNDNRALNQYLPVFQLRSKALIDKVPQQVALLKEILQNTLLEDENRIIEVIREMKAMMEAAISSEGHRIAYGRLLSNLSNAEHFEEKTKGITFYHFVCEIEKDWVNRQSETITMLKSAYQCLANKSRLIVGLTADEEAIDSVIDVIQENIDELPDISTDKLKMQFNVSKIKEALVYPTQVNYVAMGYNFKTLGYKYHGGMMLLKSLLSMDYLWSKVRVQNGAYGCFCDFRKSGNMFFVSYRDPNLKETLEVYRQIPKYLREINLTNREMLQYLIGTVSHLDFPFTPLTEGRTAQIYHIMGVTKEELQQTRDELFETTNETLRSFAALIDECINQQMYCVFSNTQNVEKVKELFNEITMV